MALTAYQIEILRLLADKRKRTGESYVAGGAALNFVLKTSRLSRDLDLFHDTTEALEVTWLSDRDFLLGSGYTIEVIREVPSFVEADIRKNNDHVLIQWVRDSAFRFFPLVEDNVLGLTLHPFDLASNKVLAMAGRLEPRDWIDTLECHKRVQPLGYLVWAACGKDPGVNPEMVLAEGARLHYSQMEIDTLAFEGGPPSAAQLSVEWKRALEQARRIVDMLPEDTLGKCFLNADKMGLYTTISIEQLQKDLQSNSIYFHEGTIGGAWPRIKKQGCIGE